MGKIDKYPYDLDVSDKDIILGSDIENGLKTKNFKMLDIKNYMLKDIKDIVHNGFTSQAYAIWSGTGLIFDVVYPNYYIEGVLYEGKTEQLTLYPADATNPRIDIIAVDITGAIQINGTPQASPTAPIYDEDTQLKIVNVLVNANATIPANIVEEVIYKENIEWSTSSTVPSADFNAIDAYQGSKCIKINGFDAGQYIRFTDSITNQTTDYDVIKFFIRLESKFIATDKIFINFYNDTVKTSSLVVSKSKYFFNIDKTGTYQAIIIPLTDFTFLSTTFNKFEISYLGDTINSAMWFDNISLLTTDIDNNNNIDVSNLVPYTGATANVDLGEFEIKTGQIELDQSPTGTAGVGIIRWNDTDGTIDVGLKGGNVTLQVGQEQVLRVVNKTGANLLESEYKCVYISGAQGNRLKVDLALSNNTLNSNKTIGLVTENINNNLEGFVTTSGLVRNINTTGSAQGETWVDGDVLYLSAVSAGGLTNVAPTTPNHKVVIGDVVRAHVTQGSISVKVNIGLAVNELHDVNVTGLTINKVLGSTTEGIWENKTIAQILGYTPASTVSPTFTGIPSAPTATLGTNTTQLATTAFVLANAGSVGSLEFNDTYKTVWNNGKGNISSNLSFGDNAAFSNTTGDNWVALGNYAGVSNTTGKFWTAVGNYAGRFINSDSWVAIGRDSASYLADGTTSLTLSTNSVFIGASTKSFANNQTNEIVIGYDAIGKGSNTVVIGNDNITNTYLKGLVTFQNAKLGLRNVADTFTSFFTNSNTASRTYTLPNRSMTVAGTDEVMLLTTDQSFTGYKTGVSSDASQTIFTLTNNVTTFASFLLELTNSSSSNGSSGTIRATNNNTGSSSSAIQIISNSTGFGGFFKNISTGVGVFNENWGTGILTKYDSKTGSTGDLMQFTKNNSLTAKVNQNGEFTAPKYNLNALHTAPSSATDTGVLGEIRYDANYMYVCVATNTWKRSAITTW